MEVISLSPLPVAAVTWNADKRGWSLAVVCKATFRLTPGVLDLATEHVPIHRADRHYDDELECSVYAPSDLAPFKPNVDVMLVGHAYAPLGTSVPRLKPRLRLAEVLDKELVIHGDRTRAGGADSSKTTSFSKTSLRYERSAGGDAYKNPVGIVVNTKDDDAMLPNIEPPGSTAGSRPVGFGPIGAAWPSRVDKLGRHADEWSHTEWFLEPIPIDVQLNYFNAAPDDQQLDQLPAAAELVLENLHPELTLFKTSLPEMRPLAYVQRPGVEPELMTMRCDTLWIDTDQQLATMTWRGQLKTNGPNEPGRCLVVLSEDGSTMSWEDVDLLREECDVPDWIERPPESTIGGEIGLDGKPKPGGHSVRGKQLHVQVMAGPIIEPAPMSREAFLAPADVHSVPAPSSAKMRAWAGDDTTELTKLVWHDGSCVDELEKQSPWDAVIAGLPPMKIDRERRRLSVQEVLRRGQPATAETIADVFQVAAEEPWFHPPFVVTAGVVTPVFDELARLRAAISTAMPHADSALRQMVSEARELLSLTWLDNLGGVANEVVTRMRDAFESSSADTPPGYLDAQIARILVQDRAYEYATLWGRNWIRASFTPHGARAGMPAYIPESSVNALPMFSHYNALVLACVDLREDEYETHPLALRVYAVARQATV